MNIAWIDVETTGLNSMKNDIIQLGLIVTSDTDEVPLFEKEYRCRPFDPFCYTKEALAVNGRTIEELREWPLPTDVVKSFIDDLEPFGKPIMFAGYNCPFDFRFVNDWMKKAGYHEHNFDYKMLDVFPLFKAYVRKNHIVLPNAKLPSACAHFNIKLDAHDAMNDIRATIEVYKRIVATIGVDPCVSI